MSICTIPSDFSLDHNKVNPLVILNQFFRQNSRQDTLQEIYLMQEQNEILKRIRLQIDHKKESSLNQSVQPTEDPETTLLKTPALHVLNCSAQRKPICRKSSLHYGLMHNRNDNNVFNDQETILETSGVLSLKKALRTEQSCQSQNRLRRKNTYTLDLDFDELSQEVTENCSRACVDTLYRLYDAYQELARKCRNIDGVEGLLQKERKEAQMLRKQNSILQKNLYETEKRLKALENEMKDLQEQREQQKKNQLKFVQVGRSVVERESALLIRQKLINQDEKQIQRKTNELRKQQELLQKERQKLDSLWSQTIAPQTLDCYVEMLNQRVKLLEGKEREAEYYRQNIQNIVEKLQGIYL